MEKKENVFLKTLAELIVWLYPEFKQPIKTASTMLDDLKNIIDNSDCLTCNEDSEEEIEDQVEVKSTKTKYRYPPRYWTCEICGGKTMTIYNKCNHLRSTKHKNNASRKT